MQSPAKQKVVVIGDSTIDNRVWLGKEFIQFGLSALLRKSHPRTYQFLSRAVDLFALFIPFQPQSVIAHMRDQLVNSEVVDLTNDGFTTTDVLQGANRSKVFGAKAHRLFPDKMFYPLESAEIEKADQIVISVGGNNFREFLVEVQSKEYPDERATFIQSEYPKVFEKIQAEYLAILRQITTRNPHANIILMTQYYPSIVQSMLLIGPDGHRISIYDGMASLSDALHLCEGKAQLDSGIAATIDVMEQTYSGVLAGIAADPSLSRQDISVIDATSSINPTISQNHTAQIEPSSAGGLKIAHMISHVAACEHSSNKVYRFMPAFFTSNEARHVLTCDMTTGMRFVPVYPKQMAAAPSLLSRLLLWFGWSQPKAIQPNQYDFAPSMNPLLSLGDLHSDPVIHGGLMPSAKQGGQSSKPKKRPVPIPAW